MTQFEACNIRKPLLLMTDNQIMINKNERKQSEFERAPKQGEY